MCAEALLKANLNTSVTKFNTCLNANVKDPYSSYSILQNASVQHPDRRFIITFEHLTLMHALQEGTLGLHI